MSFAAVVVAHAVDIATQQEHWPVSNYPMYSGVAQPWAARSDLVGVLADGREVALDLRHHLHPLDPSRLNNWLGGVQATRGSAGVRQAVGVLLARYDALRSRGDHHGPEVAGLRLYRRVWRLHPGMAADTAPARSTLEHTALRVASTADQSARPLPPGDVLLSAADATVSGAFALHPPTGHILVRGEGHAAAAPTGASLPRDRATWRFRAPAGTYALWMRGTSVGDDHTDSVWLTLDGLPLTPTSGASPAAQGFGNWRDVFPPGAPAWSSTSPAAPGWRVQLRGGQEHELVLTARHQPCAVSQIWLSRTQELPPAFAGPLRATPDPSDAPDAPVPGSSGEAP